MKKNFIGIDVLRGIGIFSVVTLHTSFYYFDGIYDLDLSDPPLIITLIGFVLMFAGMFAMISGFVHTLQTYRKVKEKGFTLKATLKYSFFAGLYVLLIAYLYFLFTGPGIILFDTRSMDQSVFVELIKNGKLIFPSVERFLYVDSLVMIGSNIILLGVISFIGLKFIKSDSKRGYYFYICAVMILLISIFRIPLYDTYLTARDDGNYFLVVILNWFVNKNNPILPFLAFALFGAWLSTLIMEDNKKKTRNLVIPSSIIFIIIGLTIYITAEETMLDRRIDYTWYGIMVFQIGLFKLMILGFLKMYDFRKKERKMNIVSRFLYRFGIAGLTVFFIEQIFSSIFKEILILFNKDLFLDIPISIAIGILLALMWGFLLKLWSKHNYKYGIEYFYVKFMSKFGGSEKQSKLEE
ncbi:hypothetical protein OAO42_00930 [Candidatus Izimaplasma bacterium]|nr:hypothetical protein [Candidatus Izimaplasma bacterium]